ncbi:EFR1 family ferrodoxin [Alloiococcus sp. CFN-8]|uniref:EFR1 family ferrodoxin n=1 Tax=Alloiococcus sp. CFN-8 TaxID=3416081 RepID=UPI003CED6F6D
MVYAMYFSATGTTKKVVELIAEVLGEGLNCTSETIDFTLPIVREQKRSLEKDDIVVFGTPVYAGRVPNVLLKYIKGIEGNGAKAIPIVLYGNRNYDDALIELRNLLEEDGFRTIAAGAFVGEHSFSYTLAQGRPDEQDLKIAKDFGKSIVNMLKDNSEHSPVSVNGQTPIRGYYQPRDRKGNSIDIRKVKPKTTDSCISCKLCAEVCPMGAISFEDVRVYQNICIKCGACIKKCPTQAKYFDDPGFLYHKEELEVGLGNKRAVVETFL